MRLRSSSRLLSRAMLAESSWRSWPMTSAAARGASAAVSLRRSTSAMVWRASAWVLAGPVQAWFYDPPWTVPALRRNEVAVPVARR